MGFIPAQGSKIDTKELHLARKYVNYKKIDCKYKNEMSQN
jgi:hypothetical protein